jgi:hypothetical protein
VKFPWTINILFKTVFSGGGDYWKGEEIKKE